MNKFIFCLIFISTTISCKKNVENELLHPVSNANISDAVYVQNDSFPKGDVRRYGVYPNKPISEKKMTRIITLATKGIPITFPQGLYRTNLILKNVSNVNFFFKDATINGAVSILDSSNRIKFNGRLTILDKLFIRKSNNITFDTIFLKSDTLINLHHRKNRGVSIYVASKNIFFNTLEINDTGGDADDFYTHSAAALQIHGWNNNPEHVYINKLKINNSARTALYFTGNGHRIGSATIANFGKGSTHNIFSLGDAKPGEEKEFTGAWVNKCNDCLIDSLSISGDIFKGTYRLRLDEGIYHEPTFINNIHFSDKVKELPIKDDELTNVLVKNEY